RHQLLELGAFARVEALRASDLVDQLVDGLLRRQLAGRDVSGEGVEVGRRRGAGHARDVVDIVGSLGSVRTFGAARAARAFRAANAAGAADSSHEHLAEYMVWLHGIVDGSPRVVTGASAIATCIGRHPERLRGTIAG